MPGLCEHFSPPREDAAFIPKAREHMLMLRNKKNSWVALQLFSETLYTPSAEQFFLPQLQAHLRFANFLFIFLFPAEVYM